MRVEQRRKMIPSVLVLEEVGAGLYTAPFEEESKCRWMFAVLPKGMHPRARSSVSLSHKARTPLYISRPGSLCGVIFGHFKLHNLQA
jgi:ABC-type branched-subunit amino acid transport system ATPase component